MMTALALMIDPCPSLLSTETLHIGSLSQVEGPRATTESLSKDLNQVSHPIEARENNYIIPVNDSKRFL